MAKSYNPFAIFRKNNKIALAFITLLSMFAFVCVGPSLMGRANNGSGPGQVPLLAKWNYGDITQAEVSSKLTWRVRINKFLTLLHEKAADIGKMDRDTRPILFEPESQGGILESMVLDKKAELLGMSVSDASINNFINRVSGNALSQEDKSAILLKAVGDSRGSPSMLSDQLFDALRFELRVRYFTSLLFNDSVDYNTPEERWDYFSRLNRQATVQVVPVAVKDFVDQVPTPGNDELEKLFDQFKDRLPQPQFPDPGFMMPARAKFQYIKAPQDKLAKADEAQITDKQIDDYYQQNKESYRKSTFDESSLTPSSEKPATVSPKATEPPKTDEKSKATEKPKADEKPRAGDTAKPATPKNDDKSKTPDAGKTPANPAAPAKPATNAPPPAKPATDKTTDKPAADKPASDKSSDSRPAIHPFADNELLALADTASPATTTPPPAAKTDTPPAPTSPAKTADKAAADKAAADKAAANTATADKATADKAAADKAAADKAAADKATAAKTEPAKPEPAKTTPPATPAKAEPAKAEPAKTEPAKTGPAKVESPKKAETPKAGSESSNADEFRSLSDPKLRAEIRSTLANEIAAREINDNLKKIRTQVQNYGRAVSAWIGDGKPPAEEPEAPDFAATAKGSGMTFESTGSLSAEEAEEQTELGKSMEFNEIVRRVTYFTQTAFDPNLASYVPTQSMSPDGKTSYLWWRTDYAAAYVPTFADAKPEVVRAWKVIEARKLALAEAKKDADDANNRRASLKDIFLNRANVTVPTIGPFHWLTIGNTPMGSSMRPTIGITQISGLDLAGEDFMRAVFTTDVGKTTEAFNQPQTIAYVVQVQSIDPPEDVFRQQFLKAQQEAFEQRDAGQAGAAARALADEARQAKLRAIERDLGLKLVATPAQLAGSSSGPAAPPEDEGDE
ncbi:MAG TPA: hypothetical protein VHX65_00275 [Pirellulales bacterium]|jgi:hypothetical protein|nr:hypothetical protein [Pirellulales bacterium]